MPIPRNPIDYLTYAAYRAQREYGMTVEQCRRLFTDQTETELGRYERRYQGYDFRADSDSRIYEAKDEIMREQDDE